MARLKFFVGGSKIMKFREIFLPSSKISCYTVYSVVKLGGPGDEAATLYIYTSMHMC